MQKDKYADKLQSARELLALRADVLARPADIAIPQDLDWMNDVDWDAVEQFVAKASRN